MKDFIRNKKAYYDYSVLSEYEAGIILTGDEVRSIRNGNITILDSFIYLKNNEVFIKNLNISKYNRKHPSSFHDENRTKKLLLNKKEIFKIKKELEVKGITCIPLSLYEKDNKVKVKVGICKGKKEFDKRETIKKREQQRDIKNYV